MAAKVPRAVKIAKDSINDGMCVVIGLQNTGEANIAEGDEDGNAASTASGIITNFLET